MLSNLNLIGIFVTHFQFGHRLSNLHYPVFQLQLSWVIFSYSHSSLPEVSTVMWPQQHVGAEQKLCGPIKMVYNFLSLISYLHWKVLLHAINVWPATPVFTSHPMEFVLQIFITLRNSLTLAGFEPQILGPVASTLPLGILVNWRSKYNLYKSVLMSSLYKNYHTTLLYEHFSKTYHC